MSSSSATNQDESEKEFLSRVRKSSYNKIEHVIKTIYICHGFIITSYGEAIGDAVMEWFNKEFAAAVIPFDHNALGLRQYGTRFLPEELSISGKEFTISDDWKDAMEDWIPKYKKQTAALQDTDQLVRDWDRLVDFYRNQAMGGGPNWKNAKET